MNTHATSPSSQISASARAAIGAAVSVFIGAISILAVAVPSWMAHVAEYNRMDHDNVMFGDPAGWLMMAAVVLLTPIAFAAFGTFGAATALGSRCKEGITGGVQLFFLLVALTAPTGYVVGGVLSKRVPTIVAIVEVVLVFAAGAAVGGASGVLKPLATAS
jgi:hypothetical protein